MGTRHGLRPNFQHRLIPLAGLVAAVRSSPPQASCATAKAERKYQVKATYLYNSADL